MATFRTVAVVTLAFGVLAWGGESRAGDEGEKTQVRVVSEHFLLELPPVALEAELDAAKMIARTLEVAARDVDSCFVDAKILKPPTAAKSTRKAANTKEGEGGPSGDTGGVEVVMGPIGRGKYADRWKCRLFRSRESEEGILGPDGVVLNATGNLFVLDQRNEFLALVLPKGRDPVSVAEFNRELLACGAQAAAWFRGKFSIDFRKNPSGACIGWGFYCYYNWSVLRKEGTPSGTVGGMFPHILSQLQEEVRRGNAPKLSNLLALTNRAFQSDSDTWNSWSAALVDFLRNHEGARPGEFAEMLRAYGRLGLSPDAYPAEVLLAAYKREYKSMAAVETAFHGFILKEATPLQEARKKAADAGSEDSKDAGGGAK